MCFYTHHLGISKNQVAKSSQVYTTCKLKSLKKWSKQENYLLSLSLGFSLLLKPFQGDSVAGSIGSSMETVEETSVAFGWGDSSVLYMKKMMDIVVLKIQSSNIVWNLRLLNRTWLRISHCKWDTGMFRRNSWFVDSCQSISSTTSWLLTYQIPLGLDSIKMWCSWCWGEGPHNFWGGVKGLRAFT